MPDGVQESNWAASLDRETIYFLPNLFGKPLEGQILLHVILLH